MSILADINAISESSAELASDQADLAALQLQVAGKVAEIENDSTASAQADAALSTDLAASGPVFVLGADGNVKVYSFSDQPPGYMIVTATPAT